MSKLIVFKLTLVIEKTYMVESDSPDNIRIIAKPRFIKELESNFSLYERAHFANAFNFLINFIVFEGSFKELLMKLFLQYPIMKLLDIA